MTLTTQQGSMSIELFKDRVEKTRDFRSTRETRRLIQENRSQKLLSNMNKNSIYRIKNENTLTNIGDILKDTEVFFSRNV